ncbi:hypothetical protein [Massilia sp. X63]|uniref:hypothetical protein n=1 Tax=Massilia sp. X63 TaxID=3237285 RepID=UPI0034DCE1E2
MAQLDFFGLDEDFYNVMQFVFSETDLIVYEAYSRVDHDIRKLSCVDDLRSIAHEREGGCFLLRSWSPAVTNSPIFKTFKLRPEIGAHRTSLEGSGLMQFAQGRIEGGLLHSSSFSHWNEAGALQRSALPTDDIDWPAMRLISGKIHRHVRNKLAVARIYSAPVLPGAYEALGPGLGIWYGAKEHRRDSDSLIEKPDRSSKQRPLRDPA